MVPRKKSLLETIESIIATDEKNRIYAIEACLADFALQHECQQPELQALNKKLSEVYKICLINFAEQIIELDRFIVGQLDQIDNLENEPSKIPLSHSNVINASFNLTHFVTRELLPHLASKIG